MKLFPTRLLDPRSTEEAEADPILGAVSIPYAELGFRTYELPPPGSLIQLPMGFDVDLAESWLRAKGYSVEFVPVELGASSGRGRLWEPNPFLAEVASQLAPGRAIDLGCGAGRDAIYLAGEGWRVTAVDHLPDALDRGRALAMRYLSAEVEIDWVRSDVLRELPPGPFDLAVMVLFHHPDVLCRALDALAPGGSLVVETFSHLHRDQTGHPASPNSALDPLSVAVPGFDALVAQSIDRGDRNYGQLWLKGLKP